MKNTLSILKMTFMMSIITVPVIFSSCSKDEDDDIIPNRKSKYSYVEPCLKWHSSIEEVESFMNALKGYKRMEGNERCTIYMNTANNVSITYTFGPSGTINGLYNAMVTYLIVDKPDKTALIFDLESRYKINLIRNSDSSSNNIEVYEADCKINGLPATIIMMYTTGITNSMSVAYILDL